MSFDAPGPVMARLAEIEKDLADRQLEYEKSAGDRARLVRDWEKALAIAHRTVKGPNADSRKALALITASEYDDGKGNVYERLTAAEDGFEACKAVIKVLETRAAIGMSILKAQSR